MRFNRVLEPKALSKAVLAVVACWLAGSPAAEAALSGTLQGQNRGTNVWTTQNLQSWRELDFIPLRTLFTGGPATNQVVVVAFDHTAGSGARKGIENLTTFTHSTNLVITSGPTLSITNNFDIWFYTYTITITNSQPAFVEFRGRLSAGAHQFTGASLNLRGFLNGGPIGNLGIFKPAAFPGFPDLAVTKVGAAVATTNDTISYAINYTNKTTTTNLAIGVQVTDVLPGAVTYVPGSASGGGTLVGDTLIWDLGDLRVGTNGTLTYKVTTRSNLVNGQTFNNNAQILNAQDDLNTADNSASFQTMVVVAPTPVALDDSYSTLINTPLIVSATNGVLVNDMELGTNVLTATLFSGVTNGMISANADGSFTYTPNLDFVGVDTFTYRAFNGTNTSGPAVVTINVTNTCSLTVTTTNDSGPGSLRQAILCANGVPGTDTVRFNIPGPGPHMIIPLSTLPLITDTVIIDGYTQPGASENQLPDGNNAVLMIEISGAAVGNNGDGLFITGGGSGSTIRGLVIGGGFSSGIRIASASNNVIEGCFLGTDPTGTIARGNTVGLGIDFGGDSSSARIGGTLPAARNVISGNTTGILIRSGTNHLIQGNFIGTAATGASALANNTGIEIRTSSNLIGGSDASARNVIAGAGSGPGIVVSVELSPTAGNRIQGNFIGTDAGGTLPLGLNSGIELRSGSSATLIGGLASAPGTPPGNVISASLQFGVDVAGVDDNVIQGNLIGTDSIGSSDLGNSLDGVRITEGSGNLVGGGSVNARNVISGNNRHGVLISVGGSDTGRGGNFVQGNFIGTGITGTSLLGNSSNGVLILSSTNNVIGGAATTPGLPPGNLIAGNAGHGVEIQRLSVSPNGNVVQGNSMLINALEGVSFNGGSNNAVLGNSIAANGRLGIDLIRIGFESGGVVTANDAGDLDDGPNQLQNFPVITSVVTNIGTVTIQGFLDSAPSTTFRLEFFANAVCDASGFGEGEQFLGFTNVTTGIDGTINFTVTFNTSAISPFVTATATDPGGNTSEFSACFSPCTMDCPANITTNAAPGQCGTVVVYPAPTTNGTCGTVTCSPVSGAFFPVGVTTVMCSNTSGGSCTFTVTVLDTEPPAITIQGANPLTTECHTAFADPGASGSDSCAASVVMTTNSTVNADSTGNYLITYTATDPSGNATTNTRTVVVHDTTPPLITMNLVGGFATVTNECHTPFVDPGASGSDSCAASVVMTTNSTVNADSTGNYLITYTATDPTGNATTNTRTVVVHDTTPPLITMNLVGGFATVTNECHTPFVDPGASGSDTCAGPLVVVTNTTVNPDATGTYTISYAATDPSGNSTTNFRTVVVNDTTAPTVLLAGAATVTNDCHTPFVDPGASASDTCAGPLVVVTNSTVNPDATGSYTISYAATDPSGNSTTNFRTVVVNDTTPPTVLLTGAATVTNECHTPFVDPGASANDTCAGALVVVTNSTVDANTVGSYQISYAATDPSGNSTTNFRTVVVSDTTLPTVQLTGAESLTNECHTAFVDPGATASDTCAGALVVVTNSTVDANTVGSYQISYAATDPSGNSTTNFRTVVISDTTAPTVLLTGAATVTYECHTPFVDPGASASDTCAGPLVVVTNSTVNPDATGTYTISYAATDPSGNSATNFRTVVVVDTTPPLITCPAGIVTNAAPTESGVVVSFATPIPTDTCGSASATCSPASGSIFPVGVTTVICTAMDTAGNTTNCGFTVTVIAPPVVDLGLTMDAAPDPVTVGGNLIYTITVTNAGPDTATGVMVTNLLPASVTYVSSLSSQGTTAPGNGVVTFDLGTVVNGATVSMSISVTPNAAGLITNTASVTAAEFDPNPTNSVASNVSVVMPDVTLTAGFLTGVTFNLQTGLFEQKIVLTNSGATITNATRVYVHGLPAANNLYNASGITNGLPFVQYNLPLLSASNVVFLLEYYFANGVPVTNLAFTAEEVLPATSPTIPTNAVLVALEVGRAPLPLVNLNNGRFLIEWAAIEGRTYTVQYSTNLTNWQTVVPSIVAPANRVQWLDDGPPKTESKPGVPPARFYRVFLLP